MVRVDFSHMSCQKYRSCKFLKEHFFVIWVIINTWLKIKIIKILREETFLLIVLQNSHTAFVIFSINYGFSINCSFFCFCILVNFFANTSSKWQFNTFVIKMFCLPNFSFWVHNFMDVIVVNNHRSIFWIYLSFNFSQKNVFENMN